MRHSIPFFLLTGWLVLATPGHADDYALIIGAGKYPGLAHLRNSHGGYGFDLDGPRPDALKLREVLIAKYGYRQDSVVVLLDEQATRKAILENIDRLASQVKAGDRVLIYFSGHGTSSQDPDNHGFGMAPHTGAIIPSDLRPADSNAALYAQLIVGKRDLQPRLSRIEQKADVLVIFDSCFSGESVKSLNMIDSAAPRFVSLADLTSGTVSSRSLVSAETASRSKSLGGDVYPYRRVVYFSAAAINEYAQDIAPPVRGKFATVDGQPHGALTNVLLKALAGNVAGQSCRSLYETISKQVLDQSGEASLPEQHPQLLAPDDPATVGRPCFGESAGGAPSPPPVPESAIRADLDRIARAANGNLDCQPDKPSYRSGEHTVLRCTFPERGYVNVISFGEGDPKAVLLLPNRYQRSNQVEAGEVQIPSGFNITNVLPSGMARQEQVMLVLFTAEPLELQSLGVPEGIFTGLAEAGTRNIRSQIATAYSAVELVFPITR